MSIERPRPHLGGGAFSWVHNTVSFPLPGPAAWFERTPRDQVPTLEQ